MKIWLSFLAASTLFVFPATLLAQTPLSARTLVALANEDRTEASVGTLREDPLLSKAAQKKADDMAARGYFSHTGPDGRRPWHWFTSVGYYYTSAGENLAVNFDDARTLEDAWMNSPTHRANIVKAKFTRMGIGIAYGTYKGKPATFVVQFFAAPAQPTRLAKR